MDSPFFFLLFPLITITNLPLTISQPQLCSNTNGIYLPNTTYSQNLDKILSSLPLKTIENGVFCNSTKGFQPDDKVYASALCRGDISSNSCYTCLNSSIAGIRKQCPNSKEAIFWGDSVCIVRYSNRETFSRLITSPSECVPNPNNIVSQLFDQFNLTLNDLLAKLAMQASLGGSYFAAGDQSFTSLEKDKKVFGLAQCTPDVSQADCRNCLQGSIAEMGECSGGNEGGRILKPSCILWFEMFKFYDSPSTQFSPTPLVDSASGPAAHFRPPSTVTKSTKARNLILITVPLIILSILVAIAYAILRKRRVENDDDEIKRLESLKLDLSTINMATDGFSEANKLGQGGFGSVYKGVLPNGQEFAAKRLSGYSAQGEKEFKNEVMLMSKLQHRNLISLIGFCSEGTEKILVYEFMRNGSLDNFIFDEIKSAHMNWEMRYKIMYGIARGTLYLHEDSRLKIIHCDLKASNVLLDEVMNPKISDFGMARLFAFDQTQVIASRAAGTYGYMAPEYALLKQFSTKCDVFSFGVLILEIISGKKNSWLTSSGEIEHLLSHSWKHWRNGTASLLIDNAMSRNRTSEIMRCIQIGLLCVQENAADRPTMASVVLMLSSHCMSLPEPSQPAFLMYSTGSNRLESSGTTSTSDQSTVYTEATMW